MSKINHITVFFINLTKCRNRQSRIQRNYACMEQILEQQITLKAKLKEYKKKDVCKRSTGSKTE